MLDRARRGDGARAFRRELPEDALDAHPRGGAPARSARRERRVRARPRRGRRAARWSCRCRRAAAARRRPGSSAVRDAGGLGDFERLILQQAVTVVALELMRQRAMRDTERRLAGDVLAEALVGRARRAPSCATRLRPFGIGAQAAVLVFGAATCRRAAEPTLDRLPRRRRRRRAGGHARAACSARWSTRGEDLDPVELAARARDASSPRRHGGRARRRQPPGAGGRAAALASTRRAARSRPPRSANGSTPGRGLLPRPRRVPAAARRSRTTRRCGSTATACSGRSRTAAASTATS